MTPLLNGPWQQVSSDFVVIDNNSIFPEVEVVHSTSAKVVILKLDLIFVAHGVPQVVKSVNAPL